MTRANEIAVEEIPEVVAFEEVRKRLQDFKDKNPEFFKYLDGIAEEYNDKMDAAKKVVKARGVSCGPFERYQTATKYDANIMYTLLGHEKFLKMGGREELIKVRTLDKKRVEMYIKSGDIEEDAAAVIKTVSPRYRSLDEIKVP